MLQLASSSLVLRYSDPNLTSTEVGVQSAQWRGNAHVRVKDEQGKKWIVGFVQVLHKNVMTAVYKKTKVSEILKASKSLPVLDGPDDDPDYDRPFYDNVGEGAVEVNTPAGAAAGIQSSAVIKLWDEPESHFDWWYNDDPTDPLEEFHMFLTFSTYIGARDVTAGLLPPMKMTWLRQWDVVLDRRYKFDLHRDSTQATLQANLGRTTCRAENPQKQPFVINHDFRIEAPANSVLTGPVANDVFTDDIKPVGQRQVGEGIKSIAARFGRIV